MHDRPSWWTEAHTSSWEQVKEALRRDWTQTRHDVHLGGHELNQNAMDTLGQTVGEVAMPPSGVANRPTVVGRWEDAEVAIGFGYAARTQFGDRFPVWCSELEGILKHDWKSAVLPWGKAEGFVHHGYDIRH
jgi:hypothetical protein